MPGITHWQHPSFFAFFPSITNFESILADMYATSVSNPGFNVSASLTFRMVIVAEYVIPRSGIVLLRVQNWKWW
jgi:hypothetical protein